MVSALLVDYPSTCSTYLIEEGNAMVRWSSHSGKGTGGQIAQMRSIEEVQTGSSRQPK